MAVVCWGLEGSGWLALKRDILGGKWSTSSKELVGAVSALFLAALATGCGGGGGSDSGTSGSTGTPSGSGAANSKLSGAVAPSGSGTVNSGISGTVADGLAMAKAKITVQSANGNTVDVGTTDDSGQYSGFAFPPGFQFPAVMSVTRTVGSGVLRSIIPSLPSTGQSANINPITQAITSLVLPIGSSLANLDVTDGDLGFAKKAKTVVQTAFGTAIDYDTFAGKSFKARTATDSKAGGLADTLIDTMAGMDSTRKPEDILASAADSKDPAVSKSLMSNPAFQARLAGELISQGRPADDVKTMIQNESIISADTTALLANTAAYAKSFEEVYTSAVGEMTGSDGQKRASLESIVESAAVAISQIVEKKGVSSGDSLTNVLTNSMAMVKGPLIAIGKTNQKTNQERANLGMILSATRDQMSSLITASTVDLTVSGANTATLVTQVKNFGEIVSSAVAQSLNSGKDKSKLDDKEKMLVATNLGKGITSSLSSYMSDMAVDFSAMTDTQKANMTKAGNAAKNTATALDSALVEMAADQGADNLNNEVLNSMAEALVTQS